MTETLLSQPAFELVGGHAALDFANTLGGLRGGVTHEHLGGYAGLAAWVAQAGLLDRGTASSLRRAGPSPAPSPAARPSMRFFPRWRPAGAHRRVRSS